MTPPRTTRICSHPARRVPETLGIRAPLAPARVRRDAAAPSTGRKAVLVVDDRALAGQALRTSLRRLTLDAAHITPNGGDAVRAIGARRYDVIVVSVGHTGTDAALLALGDLTSTGVPVVALLDGDDAADVGRCLAAGAAGVVRSTEPLSALVNSVERAAAGLALVTANARTQAIVDLRERERTIADQRAPFANLSKRESEVLRLIVGGRTAAQIAEESFVSIATVRTQIRSILQKLDVNSQVAAAGLARTVGWS